MKLVERDQAMNEIMSDMKREITEAILDLIKASRDVGRLEQVSAEMVVQAEARQADALTHLFKLIRQSGALL